MVLLQMQKLGRPSAARQGWSDIKSFAEMVPATATADAKTALVAAAVHQWSQLGPR